MISLRLIFPVLLASSITPFVQPEHESIKEYDFYSEEVREEDLVDSKRRLLLDTKSLKAWSVKLVSKDEPIILLRRLVNNKGPKPGNDFNSVMGWAFTAAVVATTVYTTTSWVRRERRRGASSAECRRNYQRTVQTASREPKRKTNARERQDWLKDNWGTGWYQRSRVPLFGPR